MKLSFRKWFSRRSHAQDKSLPENVRSAKAADQLDSDTNSRGKILIVDDNPVVLKAFELKLSALGFTILTASDGGSAVTIARNERPDLIILDLNFPPDVGSSGLQWTGFKIMQWLQRFQDVAVIPVIIITSDDPAEFKEKALAAGAFAFFQKPINQEELLLTIYRALGASGTKFDPKHGN